MRPFALALRNIVAHRRRNLILFLVVAIVSSVLFVMLAFSDGEIEGFKYGIGSFDYAVSDLKAVKAGFREAVARRDDEVLEYTVTGMDGLVSSLEATGVVDFAYPYSAASWGDLFAAGIRYKYFGFRYVDPLRETYLRERYTVTRGRDLEPGDAYAILLHEKVRATMPIREGDRVRLVGSDFFGQAFSQEVTVAGFFKPAADNPNLCQYALVDASTRSVVTGYAPDEWNGVEIHLKRGVRPEAAVELLRKEWIPSGGKGLEVDTAAKIVGMHGNETIFRMVRLIVVFMCMVTIGIVSFGIMNVVSVNLFDRRKEIGTYYCLGAERPFLLAMYTWEMLVVNLAGAAAGILLGLGIRAGINALRLTSEEPGVQVVFGGNVFHLGLSWGTAAWIVGGIVTVTVVTALATLGPSLKVSPVEAIRETE